MVNAGARVATYLLQLVLALLQVQVFLDSGVLPGKFDDFPPVQIVE